MDNSGVDEIISFWKGRISPNVHCHPADISALSPIKVSDTDPIMRYLAEKFPQPFDYSLLPSPYNGNIRSAKIFFLMLNPGLSLTDYHVMENSEFIRKSINIINQEGFDPDFPFSCLNPKFYYWSGFQYWQRKLHALIRQIKETGKFNTYYDAMSFLAQNIAVIEYVAYHSKDFGMHQLDASRKLASTEKMQLYVNHLIERAKKQEIILLVDRGAKHWHGLKEVPTCQSSHIIINKGRPFILTRTENTPIDMLVKFLL